jgi:hypothetical protein
LPDSATEPDEAPGGRSVRDHSSMRLRDGELNVAWPLKKELSDRLAVPSKLPDAGAALMLIESGAEPPANRTSGRDDDASTEKFSPRQMPVADSEAVLFNEPHSTAPASPVTIAPLSPPPRSMIWPSLNSTVPNESSASFDRFGLVGFSASTVRAFSMAW